MQPGAGRGGAGGPRLVAPTAPVGRPVLKKAKAQPSLADRKNTSVIRIWLDGGPGHMDMYDMKPDAPAEYRGIWRPIRTKVPGFDVTELNDGGKIVKVIGFFGRLEAGAPAG